jgi:hypothetical protein
MANILTNTQVAQALYLDEDYDQEELQRYAKSASAFIYRKTGYDFASQYPIEPLAIECAMQYVRQLHFGSTGYNKEHDYSLGIQSLIVDLQVIANDKI